jgi:hypothetical protein
MPELHGVPRNLQARMQSSQAVDIFRSFNFMTDQYILQSVQGTFRVQNCWCRAHCTGKTDKRKLTRAGAWNSEGWPPAGWAAAAGAWTRPAEAATAASSMVQHHCCRGVELLAAPHIPPRKRLVGVRHHLSWLGLLLSQGIHIFW